MGNETIVLLIVMILAIIVTVITVIAANKRDQHFIYIHTKTGNRYRVIQECKMKYDGKWMDAIAYISEEDSEMYVREYSDFVLNFKRLSEWKEN
jgi:hypothetical protein